jgi:hypothetical protein
MYPNPTKDVVNIDILEDILSAVTIQVIDIKGKVITQTSTQSKQIQLDSSSWTKGCYLIIVSSGNETYRQIIIKQ